MSKNTRTLLDKTEEKYGRCEKWQVWACIVATVCYFVIPYAVNYFIMLSPTLMTLVSSINYTWYLIFSIIVQYILTFAVVVACFGKYFLRSFGTFFGSFFKNIGTLVVLYFAVIFALNLVSPLYTMLNPESTNANQQSLDTVGARLPILMFIVTVVIAPICEEFIFRWGVFRPMHKWSPVVAHLFTAVLFSFVHIAYAVILEQDVSELSNMLMYLPISFGLSLAYEFTGTLAAPILLHMFWNASAYLA